MKGAGVVIVVLMGRENGVIIVTGCSQGGASGHAVFGPLPFFFHDVLCNGPVACNVILDGLQGESEAQVFVNVARIHFFEWGGGQLGEGNLEGKKSVCLCVCACVCVLVCVGEKRKRCVSRERKRWRESLGMMARTKGPSKTTVAFLGTGLGVLHFVMLDTVFSPDLVQSMPRRPCASCLHFPFWGFGCCVGKWLGSTRKEQKEKNKTKNKKRRKGLLVCVWVVCVHANPTTEAEQSVNQLLGKAKARWWWWWDRKHNFGHVLLDFFSRLGAGFRLRPFVVCLVCLFFLLFLSFFFLSFFLALRSSLLFAWRFARSEGWRVFFALLCSSKGCFFFFFVPSSFLFCLPPPSFFFCVCVTSVRHKQQPIHPSTCSLIHPIVKAGKWRQWHWQCSLHTHTNTHTNGFFNSVFPLPHNLFQYCCFVYASTNVL